MWWIVPFVVPVPAISHVKKTLSSWNFHSFLLFIPLPSSTVISTVSCLAQNYQFDTWHRPEQTSDWSRLCFPTHYLIKCCCCRRRRRGELVNVFKYMLTLRHTDPRITVFQTGGTQRFRENQSLFRVWGWGSAFDSVRHLLVQEGAGRMKREKNITFGQTFKCVSIN